MPVPELKARQEYVDYVAECGRVLNIVFCQSDKCRQRRKLLHEVVSVSGCRQPLMDQVEQEMVFVIVKDLHSTWLCQVSSVRFRYKAHCYEQMQHSETAQQTSQAGLQCTAEHSQSFYNQKFGTMLCFACDAR